MSWVSLTIQRLSEREAYPLARLNLDELLQEYLVVLIDNVLALALLYLVNEPLVVVQLVAVLGAQFRLAAGRPPLDLLEALLVAVQFPSDVSVSTLLLFELLLDDVGGPVDED